MQIWRRSYRLAVILLATATSAGAHTRTYLLSVHLPIGKISYVNAFAIDTWGVTTVATCQIPPGWTISAGSSADPSGRISGEGSLGITWLDRKHAGYLRDIVLIRLAGAVQRRAIRSGTGEVPATFAGDATVGDYGGDDEDRKVRLTWRDIRLTRAHRCPAPRF